jgi:dihydrofolate reductase
MIALIVARAKNGVIGRNNDLPWHLPADLKHFKEITTGHTVIMGRKTFESIYKRLKGPLPNRQNFVVSRTLTNLAKGFSVFRTLHDALEASHAEQTTFIIGGTSLFKESLNKRLVDEIYLTEVKTDVGGDAYFPPLQNDEWEELAREDHVADERNPYAYSFIHLRKKHE